jgi:hypothetical protein
MKQIKVDKVMLMGITSNQVEDGEYVQFEIPMTIDGGRITIDGDNVLITYNTLKENMYGHDITPKVNFFNSKDVIENESEVESMNDIELRPINDEEYNAINEFLKEDYNRILSDDTYVNQKRSRLSVYDINDDFKIINVNDCTVYNMSNGKSHVNWDTFRYAYKHGLIYPYDENESGDDCNEDISEIV